MKDGAHQKHGLKPNPYPESELQRTLPVADPKTHNKVSDYEGDDKVLRKLADELPSRRPDIGHCGRVDGAHFEICRAEQKRTYQSAPSTNATTTATMTAQKFILFMSYVPLDTSKIRRLEPRLWSPRGTTEVVPFQNLWRDLRFVRKDAGLP